MSPGGRDPAVLRRHLLALDEALQGLRPNRGITVQLLREDREKLWAIERGLQIAAQNALDIATHLAAAAGRDVPDYASAIDRLAALGVLPAAFAEQFRSIAGFRNVLVHGYLDIDVALLHRILVTRLDDFATFARHIEETLKVE